MQIRSESVERTIQLGEALGRLAPAGTVIALHGQLGAGKTHFTRGIATGAKVADVTLVCSPTYVLLNIYEGGKPVFHVDAYRLGAAEGREAGGEEEFAAAGFEGILQGEGAQGGQGIVVVEWPERIPHLLPDDRVEIAIEVEDEMTRLLSFTATGPASRAVIAALREAAGAQAGTKDAPG